MRDKRTILYLLILSTFFISMMALLAYAESDINTCAKSSALYNPDTGSFLHRNNANQRLPMASTTKIMTALIAIEELDPNSIVSVTNDAVGIEGSSLYLKAGDEIRVRDLIYGVLLQSANDAAAVLAIEVAGNLDNFAELMNERAKDIGALDTHFVNPHGLDAKDHFTTAHDLALIAAEALNNETFKSIASTYKYSFMIGDTPRTVVNHNKLLKKYDGCIGVKTGFTRTSGRCLVSAASKDGITLVAVTLSDPDDWTDHKNMLDFGFKSLEKTNIKERILLPEYLPTVSNDGARVKIKIAKDYLITKKNEAFTYSINLPHYIANDVKSGDKIGEVTVRFNDREENIDVLSDEDVVVKTPKRRFFKIGELNNGKNQTSEIYG